MKGYFVVLLLLVFSLSACTQGNDGEYELDSLTGTEGVVVSVVEAPSEVYENEEFPVVFGLTNQGATGISPYEPGRFFISLDSLYLQESRSRISRFTGDSFWLKPRTQYVPGEETYLTFNLKARPIERWSERVTTPIFYSACYPYHSNITTQVCIETQRSVDLGAVVCDNRPLRPPTPAAPVGVSEVEVRTSYVHPDDGGGVRPTFRITVENLGDGRPATGNCKNDELAKGLNSVFVSAYLLDEPLDCVSEEVRLLRGRAVVQCSLPEGEAVTRGDGSNFISLLSIYLDYTYRQSGDVEVSVVR